MHRSVVTPHRTAWCRHHRATSRGTAGRVWRWDVGRGGNRVARATRPRMPRPWPRFPPDPNAVGPPHGHGRPMQPRPPAALGRVPAQRPRGRCVTRFARLPPMRPARPLCPRGLRRQVAPARCPLLRRPPCGSLPPQPALGVRPLTRHAPTADRHTLLAPPPCGALAPAHRPPLPAGHALEPRLRPPPSTGRRLPPPPRDVGPHRHPSRVLPRLHARQQVRMIPLVGIGPHAARGHAPGPCLLEAPQRPRRGGPPRDRLRPARLLPPLRGRRPRRRPRPPHGHRPGGLGLTVAAGHGHRAGAPLAQGPRILALPPHRRLPRRGNARLVAPHPPLAPRGRVRSATSHGPCVRNAGTRWPWSRARRGRWSRPSCGAARCAAPSCHAPARCAPPVAERGPGRPPQPRATPAAPPDGPAHPSVSAVPHRGDHGSSNTNRVELGLPP